MILVLALMAAAVVPNVVTMRESRRERQFFASAEDAADRAREEAIASGQTIVMWIDEANRQLVLERESSGEQESQTFGVVVIPEPVIVDSVELGGTSSSAAEWQMRFYADGTTDGGGIQFVAGRAARALEIQKSGVARLLEGDLPQAMDEKWPAGDYEYRQ